jgi:hypothetical protein
MMFCLSLTEDFTSMRILVCGSKRWTDTQAIRQELEGLPDGTLVIHGDNGYDAAGRALWGRPDVLAERGADKLAGKIATELGLEVLVFSPDWDQHDRSAGPIRNKQMLTEGRPDLVLAFTRDLRRSPGTRHMVEIARRAGVKVRVIGAEPESGTLALDLDAG